MRTALFGGSFDPPHLGHTGIALAAAECLQLDRILVTPAGRQPLKRDQHLSPYADRISMVELACRNQPRLVPCSIDAPRLDGRFNYTYDALGELRAALPRDELFCLIGADSLQTIRRWYRATEALMLVPWIVAARPGFPTNGLLPEALQSLLPAEIKAGAPEQTSPECIRVQLTAGSSRQTLWLLPGPDYEISATELRAALAAGHHGIAQQVLDPTVAEYVRTQRLYL
jgi:nicotinate-nucleotide adenylyltransferase